MEFESNRIVVLPRTTNRFLFPSLIWLLTVIIYVSVLDKSVPFLWAKTWTYSRCALINPSLLLSPAFG